MELFVFYKEPAMFFFDTMPSPVGNLKIIASELGLHGILWDAEHKSNLSNFKFASARYSENNTTIIQAKLQLNQYFLGTRKSFNLPLVFEGTNFQTKAWNQLLQIPYASTISYAEQAERIGNKNKARAVGMANKLNSLAIVVPCHRVVGKNGNLVGFAGGLDKKSYLLSLEKKYF